MEKCKFGLLAVAILLFTSCSEDKGYSDGMAYDATADTPSAEQYTDYGENPFVQVTDQAVSTFSIDVDGGSYGNVRRMLNDGWPIPEGAVRVEEFINYFAYDMGEPQGDVPVFVDGEVASCPWDNTHKIMRIGMKGKNIPKANLPASNIVFLIDVSGSMGDDDKLPLLQDCFSMFTDELRSNDYISIVTYAGADKIVLQPTAGSNKTDIKRAIDKLTSGGGTAGAKGIETAYELAQKHFIAGGNNRVILATDGDFNIGMSSNEELIALIEEKRETGIFLTSIGVGSGNLNESMLEQLADHGNGNYEYIDSKEQGRKVFIYDYNSFFTVAKDVKIQVQFNPNTVDAYRLIGYENRVLNEEDFVDDTKDAGEIGSNQTIVALYELIPHANASKASVAFTIDFRYKLPASDTSLPLSIEVPFSDQSFDQSSETLRYASSVAAFGMLLRKSEYSGSATYDDVKTWTGNASTYNPNGYKTGFLSLIDLAKASPSK